MDLLASTDITLITLLFLPTKGKTHHFRKSRCVSLISLNMKTKHSHFSLVCFLFKLNSKREQLDPDVQRALLDRSTTVVFLVNEALVFDSMPKKRRKSLK
ncbi:hypothetical protein MtrunA17_Chr8g0344631 [Medicago truncatula]|uniref:Uncharacterized protein n=1 Tax=Medicago truncatula TaxID=3880 RepID=A0A396GDL4_MEDTR|nr:hypothetical protein MtrunA17_Chr8g0344631 [Medicago truncatula]